MEKISVVIPSYNSSSYIMDAVKSALNQTYDNLEVIIADDASTDDTCVVIRKIRDPRVKIDRTHGEWRRRCSTELSIRAATGRYIAFLDSDDYWLPDKLSKQIGKMREEAASCSCTSYIEKSQKGEVLVWVPGEINYKRLLRENIIGTSSTVVYDTSTLGKIYMPSLRLAEDYATWLNMLRQCDSMLGIREPLTYRRRRSDSLSSRFVVMWWFTYRVYRDTQALSPVTSLYYLFRVLCWRLWKRVRRICIP